MGHEIAHALANHTAEKMSMSMGLAARRHRRGRRLGQPGQTMAIAATAAALAVQLPNSRSAEAEADRIGIELAAKAGYDPRAAATLWQKMGAVGGSTPPAFLSTHPGPEQRQEKLAKLAPQMQPYYAAAKNPPSHPVRVGEAARSGTG